MSIEALVNAYEKIKTEMEEKMQTEMKAAFAEFFNTHPNVHGFIWTQYTPYFNDGDECIFGVHEISPILSEEILEEVKNGNLSSYEVEDANYENEDKIDPTVKDFIRAISKVPEEVFKNAFGDHVQVVATREGFDITEYQHD